MDTDKRNKAVKEMVGSLAFLVIAMVALVVYLNMQETITITMIIFMPVLLFILSISFFRSLVRLIAFYKNNHLYSSDRNHNRSFHKSEWERLGISPNDFKIDKNNYLKDDPNKPRKITKSKYNESQNNIGEAKEELLFESRETPDELINRIKKEMSIEDNWLDSFNNRLKSDVKFEEKTDEAYFN
ncbi:MAG: hypothetical protein K6G38_04295 [Gammaproteobacteria bacterium]|nr:hypothetical protein [Gammaproteobacteria bacterium]